MKWKIFDDRASVVTGVVGLGMVLAGGLMYWRARSGGTAAGVSGGAAFGLGLGRSRLPQAPIVGQYSDGNMVTRMRASRDMPIEERIATIQDLIHKSIQDPEMRKIALRVTSRCKERDQMCEAESVYRFVKSRVRYTGDVGPIVHPDGSHEGVDLYQSARRTLEFGGGDCDDQAILNATLLALNGLEPRLRVVKQRSDPDWSHVYAGAVIDGKFVALDTTLPGTNRFDYEVRTHKQLDFPG